MNTKYLIVIAGLCALVALALYGWNKQESFEHAHSNDLLIPQLAKRVNDIAVLEISTEDKRLTLVRDDQQWLLEQQDNFPVDISKVRSVLLSLADSTRLEQKTADSALFEKLGLDDNNRVSLVAYVDSEKTNELFSIALGNANGTLGTYVLLSEEKNSWLASGQLQLDDTAAVDWMQTELFDIAPKDIVSIDIHHTADRSVRLRNETGAQVLTLQDIAEDKNPDTTKINTLATAFRAMQLLQVRQESAEELPAAVVSDLVTREGLSVRTLVFENKDNNEYWATFTASVDEDAIVPPKDNTSDTQEVIVARTREQIQTLSARLRNRVFRITNTVGKALTYQHSDLVVSKDATADQ